MAAIMLVIKRWLLQSNTGYFKAIFKTLCGQRQCGLSSLQQHTDQLLNDPGGLLNNLSQGYHESPGYQFQVNQAHKHR